MKLFKRRHLILVMVLLTTIQSTDGFINHRIKDGNRQTAGMAFKSESTAEEDQKKGGTTVEKWNATIKEGNQENSSLKSKMKVMNVPSENDSNHENITMPKSEMKSMIDRLNHLEDRLLIVHNRTKDQTKEIDFLKNSAVKTNEKHENEMNSLKDKVNLLESKLNSLINNENAVRIMKDPSHKREKREVSSTPPACKKEACAFDYSTRNKNINVSTTIESSVSLSNAIITTVELPTGSKKPKSCADLASLGHKNNGFYLVQGRQSDSILPNKIESVYCDFSSIQVKSNTQKTSSNYGVGEKRIGYVNLKTSMGVYFYFGRKSGHSMPSNKPGVVIFDREILNVGEAMSNSGIFTAPVNGIYYFSFSAVRSPAAFLLTVHLRVNTNPVAEAYALTDNPSNQYFAMGLHLTLKLKSGDQVDIYKGKEAVFKDDESGLRLTHFTGWLLEETLQDI